MQAQPRVASADASSDLDEVKRNVAVLTMEVSSMNEKLDDLLALVQTQRTPAVAHSSAYGGLRQAQPQPQQQLQNSGTFRFGSGAAPRNAGSRVFSMRRGGVNNIGSLFPAAFRCDPPRIVRRQSNPKESEERRRRAESPVMSRAFEGVGMEDTVSFGNIEAKGSKVSFEAMPSIVLPPRTSERAPEVVDESKKQLLGVMIHGSASAPPTDTQTFLSPSNQSRRGSLLTDDDGFSPTGSFEISDDASGEAPRRKRRNRASSTVPLSRGSDTAASDHGPSLLHRALSYCRAVVNTKSLAADSYVVLIADFGYLLTPFMYAMFLISVFISPIAASATRQPPTGYLVVLAVTHALTLLWVMLQTFVRYKKGAEVVDDPKVIRATYFKSPWMWLDLITIVPFEFALITVPLAFYILIFRQPILRFVRVYRLAKSTDPLQPTNRNWVLLSFFALMLITVTHLGACLYWRLEEFRPDGITKLDYVDSLYWMTATLSSTGYGDLVATRRQSKIFSTVMMLVGVTLISSMTAIVTTFLTNKDALEEDQDRMRRMMGSMLRHYSIPYTLQREVVALFPTVLGATSEQQFKDMIRLLPSFMERRIEDYLRAKLLRQVPLFANLPTPAGVTDDTPPEIVLEISRKLAVRYAAPGEFIIQAGDEGCELFILVHGAVDVLVPTGDVRMIEVEYEDGTVGDEEEVEEKSVATLRSGSFFGEIALIEDTTRTASIQAIQACELLLLTKDDFQQLVSKSKDLQAALAKAVKQRRDELTKQQLQIQNTRRKSQLVGEPTTANETGNPLLGHSDPAVAKLEVTPAPKKAVDSLSSASSTASQSDHGERLIGAADGMQMDDLEEA
jgi:CRP-like cAMP-binding protein